MDPFEELFLRIGESRDERHEAVLELGWMLEESTRAYLEEPPELHDLTPLERELSPRVFDPRLAPEEQGKVVAKLVDWTARDAVDPSILWAIGKALPEVGMDALLDVVRRRGGSFEEEAAYEALVAMEELMGWDEEGHPIDEVVQAIRRDNPLPFVMRWKEQGHGQTQDVADRVMLGLARYRHV
jgi:hypothetical protein